MSWLKNVIKRFYPLPVSLARREIADLKCKLADLKQELEQSKRKIDQGVLDSRDEILRNIWFCSRTSKESVWAHVFNNTVANSSWLVRKSFSPGRWGVGYAYLYVLYRVLNEVHPRHILDLGLGQTSRMIAQYAAAHPDVEHVVVESSSEWIAFFQRDFQLPSNSRVIQADYAIEDYLGKCAVRVFKDLEKKLEGGRFDLVSIDAPIGGDMKCLSRVDLHRIAPKALADEFVVLMDDTERKPEMDSMIELHRILLEAGISCSYATYDGMKECMVLASDSLKYLLTL